MPCQAGAGLKQHKVCEAGYRCRGLAGEAQPAAAAVCCASCSLRTPPRSISLVFTRLIAGPHRWQCCLSKSSCCCRHAADVANSTISSAYSNGNAGLLLPSFNGRVSRCCCCCCCCWPAAVTAAVWQGCCSAALLLRCCWAAVAASNSVWLTRQCVAGQAALPQAYAGLEGGSTTVGCPQRHRHICIQRLQRPQPLIAEAGSVQISPELLARNCVVCLLETDKASEQLLATCAVLRLRWKPHCPSALLPLACAQCDRVLLLVVAYGFAVNGVHCNSAQAAATAGVPTGLRDWGGDANCVAGGSRRNRCQALNWAASAAASWEAAALRNHSGRLPATALCCVVRRAAAAPSAAA